MRIAYSGGVLTTETVASPGGQARAVRLGDADGDLNEDLLVALRNTDEAWIGRGDGAGGFSEWIRLDTRDQPADLGVGDMNADGIPDVVVLSDRGRGIETFVGNGSGFDAPAATNIPDDGVTFELSTLVEGEAPGIIAISDDTGFTGSIRRLRVLANDGDGTFTQIASDRLGPDADDLTVRNQNPGFDDDDDVLAVSSVTLLVYDNDGTGALPPGNGFAGGEHYMFLNIANQPASAEDPVDQMVDAFMFFRAGLDGVVDAVRSTATPPMRVLEGSTATARIELRDFEGDPVTDPASLSLRSLDGRAVASNPVMVEPGVYDIDLDATGAGVGTERIEIGVVVGSADPVVLMPRLRVGVTDQLADLDADGAVGFSDLNRFVALVQAQDPAADLDASGSVDQGDIDLFIDLFN